ncbi:DUF1203 domain-containing protein [Nocardia iowensis]|uniref:DUF1203 domain-containing protein n=1 Tax=Nocardia iowensis TaxID=204891 RepID=A0ABX8RIK6_NOCIO|nr:DUF1203 domain-containing protein [Nocardia iowensis]QXN88290.1 DUF1203 domain-containing protein [Nocardia iowensis]
MTSNALGGLRIQAIPLGTMRRLRSQGYDDHGHPWVRRVDREGGAPLRCCLRDSLAGEGIVLISYAPVRAAVTVDAGAYDEVGPVFVHEDPCDGYVDQGRYPTDWARVRPQVLRAYRADGSIADGVRVTPGDDYDAAARELLSDTDIAFLHARNVIFGCYMLEILRA